MVLWSGHALVLSALFSFRTRDVARLAAYFVAAKPVVTLGFVSVRAPTAAVAFVSDWLLVLLAAPLTYLYARTAAPVVVVAAAAVHSLTRVLPVVSPRIIARNASTAWSRPSMTVSS